ncbi:tudor domain protein, partial [Ancylostoma caninum]
LIFFRAIYSDKVNGRRYFQVKLTHFIALDEFYVRSCKEEYRYQDMLAELKEDYKGALEDAVPQLWMKGDGAAVWYERRWQRAVVRSPATTSSVTNVELFLIDVGKTITVSSEQVVPLHECYYDSPFAYCCTIGSFEIAPGVR